MKLLLLILSCVVLGTCMSLGTRSVYAQSSQIDSLKQVISTTKSDTVKGRTLCRLCTALGKVEQIEQALKAGEDGLALSKSVRDRKGEAFCLDAGANTYMLQKAIGPALQKFELSLKINQELGDELEQSGDLNNIGLILYVQGQYDEASKYFQKALSTSKKTGNKKSMASCYGNIGNLYSA